MFLSCFYFIIPCVHPLSYRVQLKIVLIINNTAEQFRNLLKLWYYRKWKWNRRRYQVVLTSQQTSSLDKHSAECCVRSRRVKNKTESDNVRCMYQIYKLSISVTKYLIGQVSELVCGTEKKGTLSTNDLFIFT